MHIPSPDRSLRTRAIRGHLGRQNVGNDLYFSKTRTLQKTKNGTTPPLKGGVVPFFVFWRVRVFEKYRSFPTFCLPRCPLIALVRRDRSGLGICIYRVDHSKT